MLLLSTSLFAISLMLNVEIASKTPSGRNIFAWLWVVGLMVMLVGTFFIYGYWIVWYCVNYEKYYSRLRHR